MLAWLSLNLLISIPQKNEKLRRKAEAFFDSH